MVFFATSIPDQAGMPAIKIEFRAKQTLFSATQPKIFCLGIESQAEKKDWIADLKLVHERLRTGHSNSTNNQTVSIANIAATQPITEKVEQLLSPRITSKDAASNPELLNFHGPSVRAVRENFEKRTVEQ